MLVIISTVKERERFLDHINFNNIEFIKLNQWTLHPLKKTLTDDSGNCVTLEEKPTLLIIYLAKNKDQIITREELIQHVWNDRYVDNRTINATISRLRKKLGGEKNDFIETLTKVGYSLTCNVEFIEKNISEPVEISSKNNVKQSSRIAFYTLSVVFTALILFIGFWLLSDDSLPEQKILTPKDVSIEPLTYMEGWEYSQALSEDETLLAFVHSKDFKPYFSPVSHIVIQNMASKKTITIEPDYLTASPHWGPQGNTLYYKSWVQSKCWIKKVTVSEHLILSQSEQITSCGDTIFSSDINVSKDNNWLYYSAIFDGPKPAVVKRFNLQNTQTEILTAPSGTMSGDHIFSLSFDNSMLAFIREYDDLSKEIMFLNLSNGEITSLAKYDYIVNTLAWTKSGNQIAFIDSDNIINLIDIQTQKITPIYQHPEQITNLLFLSPNELLLSVGDRQTSNINQIDLSQSDLKSVTLIYSPFKDHSGAIFQSEEGEKIAFVSNRSGNYQIWLKNKSELIQLTHFENKSYIFDLSFSANGERLLFELDEKWHTLNIKTTKLTKVEMPTGQIKHSIWQCDSKDTIFTIIVQSGVWNLYSINITTQMTKKLMNGLIGINSHCLSNKYYASVINNKGIYQLHSDWTINKSIHYLPNISLHYSNEWAVGNDGIYRTDNKGRLYQFKFSTNKDNEINLGEAKITTLTIQHNKMIINDLSVSDTFIGKITIPE